MAVSKSDLLGLAATDIVNQGLDSLFQLGREHSDREFRAEQAKEGREHDFDVMKAQEALRQAGVKDKRAYDAGLLKDQRSYDKEIYERDFTDKKALKNVDQRHNLEKIDAANQGKIEAAKQKALLDAEKERATNALNYAAYKDTHSSLGEYYPKWSNNPKYSSYLTQEKDGRPNPDAIKLLSQTQMVVPKIADIESKILSSYSGSMSGVQKDFENRISAIKQNAKNPAMASSNVVLMQKLEEDMAKEDIQVSRRGMGALELAKTFGIDDLYDTAQSILDEERGTGEDKTTLRPLYEANPATGRSELVNEFSAMADPVTGGELGKTNAIRLVNAIDQEMADRKQLARTAKLQSQNHVEQSMGRKFSKNLNWDKSGNTASFGDRTNSGFIYSLGMNEGHLFDESTPVVTPYIKLGDKAITSVKGEDNIIRKHLISMDGKISPDPLTPSDVRQLVRQHALTEKKGKKTIRDLITETSEASSDYEDLVNDIKDESKKKKVKDGTRLLKFLNVYGRATGRGGVGRSELRSILDEGSKRKDPFYQQMVRIYNAWGEKVDNIQTVDSMDNRILLNTNLQMLINREIARESR